MMKAYSTSKSYFHHTLLEERVSALVASDQKDGPIGYMPIDTDKAIYIMRRLTPKECARCQGFDGDYCSELENDDPTNEESAFWRKVWDEWCDINGKKHKTDNQIRKWLMSPPTDSVQYRMWGNGVSLPIPAFILDRIAKSERGELDATSCGRTSDG